MNLTMTNIWVILKSDKFSQLSKIELRKSKKIKIGKKKLLNNGTTQPMRKTKQLQKLKQLVFFDTVSYN